MSLFPRGPEVERGQQSMLCPGSLGTHCMGEPSGGDSVPSWVPGSPLPPGLKDPGMVADASQALVGT